RRLSPPATLFPYTTLFRSPCELVLLDLPEKNELVRDWLLEVESRAPTRYVQGNLLYLEPEELAALGRFELVWCCGVLYHNVEQLDRKSTRLNSSHQIISYA